jgi:hypothetical protein
MSTRSIRPRSKRAAVAGLTVAVAAAIAVAGCGGGSSGSANKTPNPKQAEASPPGDIPDNQAFVRYAPAGGGYSVEVPEGWARTTAGGAVVFTDKLNSVRIEAAPASVAPTLSQARSAVQSAKQSASGFQLRKVTAVKRTGGPGVRVVYIEAGKADPVTGKSRPLAVERYVFFRNGKDVTLTLSGAKGADNVDPWLRVTNSLRFAR